MNEFQRELLKMAFGSLGFEIIYLNNTPNKNGQDLYVQKNDEKPLSVEVKVARLLENGSLQVPPVEENRLADDLVAIIIGKYVLIEPMSQHILVCSEKGYRSLTVLK